jgi:hypothetical protein
MIVAVDPTLEERLQAWGTVIAVVVALGLGVWPAWRSWRRRPRLRLSSDADEDLALEIGVTDPRGTETVGHWYRVRVENGGQSSADDVEVLLMGMRGNGLPPRRPGGAPFGWTNLIDPGGRATTRVTIAPRVARHVDLLNLVRPARAIGRPDGTVGATVTLMVEPEPVDRSNVLHAGGYEVLLVVSARDTEAQHYIAESKFDGLWWSAPEVTQHLQIVRLRAIDPDVIGKFS